MYDSLEGSLSERGPSRVVVEVGGVGHDVAVPLGSAFPETGRVRVWTHLVVREDAHLLYGFPERAARDLFRLLITVQRVGPAVAMTMLSQLPWRELLEAVAAGETARLLRAKGVGRRIADQVVLDLRERAVRMLAEERRASAPAPGAAGAPSRVEDAVSALVSIGFAEKEARRSVERAAIELPSGSLEQLIRAALGRGA